MHVASNTRALSLAGNHITQLTNVHMAELTMLEELDLSSNQIEHLPADVFTPLQQLVSLDLSNNKLREIPSAAIATLRSLRRLSLAGNQIVALSWRASLPPSSVTVLDLSNNNVMHISQLFLDSLPDLDELKLAGNQLASVDADLLASAAHGLERLDLSSNFIAKLEATAVVFPDLKELNISSNQLTAIDNSWFAAFRNLNLLLVDDNPIRQIGSAAFAGAESLLELSLCRLNELQSVDDESLRGLVSLEKLSICNSSSLALIKSRAFDDLRSLQILDLQNNQLQAVSYRMFANLEKLADAFLSGNRWHCDCRMKQLRDALTLDDRDIGSDIVCWSPSTMHDVALFDANFNQSACGETNGRSRPDDGSHIVSAVQLGNDVVLDCDLTLPEVQTLTWMFGDGKTLEGRPEVPASPESLADEGEASYDADALMAQHYGVRYEVTTTSLDESEADRFQLLSNGSLMILSATRRDTGFYYCTASNRRGNFTTIVEVRLDYAFMSSIMRTSFCIGFVSAAAFFSIAAILGLIRYLAHVCSDEERAKRRSLRELLTQMRSGAHVDRLSAYRTAKMDQFAAFKSATMDQLSSFKTNRIGRLRKYKQATVSAVLHQLERMREHYAAQTARIKESYAQNVERLRENYALQRARFQDRRSVSVHHIRKQYRARAERAREYSISQVARLREQYKQQQQYFLKLLELIDVGSCVSQAVEVECMRAESAIFDAGAMAFDEEARPSHATRGEESLLFETASLPDGFPVLIDSMPSPNEDDAADDDLSDDFLPPLDIRLRSFSASNVGEGHLLMQSGNVIFHKACDADQESTSTWKKSESVPAMTVVPELNELVMMDTAL